MTLTGDITTIVNALGHPMSAPEVEAVLDLVGMPTEHSEFDIGPSRRDYLLAEDGSSELLFEDGKLDTVFVFIQPTETRTAYAAADSLINELPALTTRAAVRALLGEPEWTNETADRFAIDTYFVRFQFENDSLAKLTVMASVPR